MKTFVSIACILVIIAATNAFPASSNDNDKTKIQEAEPAQTSLLNVDQSAPNDPNDSEDELKRSVRGLGLLGFGGFGGLGNKFGSLGGLGGLGGLGHGLGSFGGGFGSWKKPFLFKGF